MDKLYTSLVLLVDDKQANLFALENMLICEGRQIICANSGKEALTMVLNREVDLIILDVHMPEMDGFEVAQILKSNNRTKNIPIIFASAEKKEYASMIQGYGEGAVDYLVKPLDPSITRAKVSILLELQLQKRELLLKNNALQKSELLINNSADIIGVIDLNTLCFEELNFAFTSILDYKAEDMIGKDVVSILYDKNLEAFKKYCTPQKEKFSFETRVVCKDQSSKWLDWNVVSKNGKLFFNARDITQAKETEKIKEFLSAQVKKSNNAIYIHGEDGKIISWNTGAEYIYGYSENEALNMYVWNLLPENIRLETKDSIRKILEGEKIYDNNLIKEVETKRITKNGESIDVIFSASIITDYTGERKSFAIHERNITQQKIADQKILQLNVDLKKNIVQLEDSNQELESFSYSVSHDLRAPLRAINTYVGIVEEDFSSQLEEEALKMLRNIQLNATRMATIIDDLLAFSKLGRKEIQMKEVNFNELVDEVLLEMTNAGKSKADIKINTLENVPADYSLLRQVWVNLLSNAIKYSSKKEHPQIEVGCMVSDNEVIYFVKDNGAGFNKAHMHKLFGVFQRLHTTNEFEGTGIGLAIAHRIVSKHGGRIWAESKINEGATFYFALQK